MARASSLAEGAWWRVSVPEATQLQKRLRERLVPHPPADFAPRLVAGADMSMARFGSRGYAGIVVIDAETMETVETATSIVDLEFPYVPGLLSFRELPAIVAAWERLETRPDVVIFDGTAIAHPRRFGIGAHGGVLLDVPSIGCAKSLLVGSHGPLGDARGSTAPIVHGGEVVGAAVRTRPGVKPVYVSAGHRMDLPTAIDIVLRMCVGFREPETTRRSHRLVNELRRLAEP
ncbi:MAG: endonuclease V [Gemmatimonadetes bacterium]|nr:endonuclease V [Gemmatimonadota bacterium]